YGPTDYVLPLEPLADKWRSFGFAVQELNGHDVGTLRNRSDSGKRKFPQHGDLLRTAGAGAIRVDGKAAETVRLMARLWFRWKELKPAD
ncbi:hypothetical protein MOV75_21260, partial [Bradyrhizobium sp. PRIMUS42]|nr:hypothetical protein [Bradyrhizobium sp. PRIMUS42]